MKILLIPNFSSQVDLKILKNLAKALSDRGHSCEVSLFPLCQNKNFPADGNSISQRFKKTEREIYKNLNIDVLLEINRFRSNYLNKKIIHINWVQDLPFSEKSKLSKTYPKSIIYTYGSPEFFGFTKTNFVGVHSLLSAYAENENNESDLRKYDLNLLGYMSPLWEIAREDDGYYPKSFSSNERDPLLLLAFKEIIQKPRTLFSLLCQDLPLNYSRFFATYEFEKLLKKIKEIYEPLSGFLDYQTKPENLGGFQKKLWNYLFVEYPRYKDRLILFNKIKELPSNISKIVAGPNWKKYYPEFHYVGEYKDEVQIFEKSKITVHNNTHGLGLHPRIFECVACGSFPIMHGTPHRKEYGSLEEALEPGRHFALYTKDNFQEVVQYWIKNDEKRKKGVQEAQAIFSENHSWDKRASQILEDIKNL